MTGCTCAVAVVRPSSLHGAKSLRQGTPGAAYWLLQGSCELLPELFVIDTDSEHTAQTPVEVRLSFKEAVIMG